MGLLSISMRNKHILSNSPLDTWEWIKYRLAIKGYTFGKLARHYGVKKTNFTNVKRVPVPKYERIIAEIVGMTPWELWPERYDSSHNPNRKKGKRPLCKPILEHENKEINGKNELNEK